MCMLDHLVPVSNEDRKRVYGLRGLEFTHPDSLPLQSFL